jgi:hypothetical protein
MTICPIYLTGYKSRMMAGTLKDVVGKFVLADIFSHITFKEFDSLINVIKIQ